MDTLSPRERLFAVLDQRPVDRVCVAQPLQTGTVELMRSSGAFWPGAHRDPELMAALAYEAFAVVGFESVRVPFDINVEAEAMGAVLDYEKGPERGLDIQPSVMKPALPTLDGLGGLTKTDPYRDGRMPVVLEAVKILKRKMPDTVPVIAAIVGPFMVAGQVRGVEHFMAELIRMPDKVHRLIEMAYNTCLSYARALAEAGADCVAIIDATSSADMISPKYYGTFSKPYATSLVRSIPVRSILHICGRTGPILKQMADVAPAISVSAQVDIGEARKAVGPGIALCGNVSSEALLFGDAVRIEKEVKACIEKGTDILCTECGVPPRAPTENLRAMVAAARRLGAARRKNEPGEPRQSVPCN